MQMLALNGHRSLPGQTLPGVLCTSQARSDPGSEFEHVVQSKQPMLATNSCQLEGAFLWPMRSNSRLPINRCQPDLHAPLSVTSVLKYV